MTPRLQKVSETSIPYAGTRPRPYATESTASSPNLTLFRQLVRNLCHGPRVRRAPRYAKVLELLREAAEPQRYIGELLDLCVHEGGPDGLDVAIDVLSETGDLLLDYTSRFLRRDYSHWRTDTPRERSSDDVWYVLARALAKSELDVQKTYCPSSPLA